MMIDAADVKPTDTGPDIKSNKNPNSHIESNVKNNLREIYLLETYIKYKIM